MIQNDHFDRTNGSLVHLQYLHPPRVGDELDKSSHPSLSSQSWPITAHHGVMWPHADQSQDSHSPIIAFLHLPRKRKMLRVGCWLSIPAPRFQLPHQMQNRYLERHRAARRRLGTKYRKKLRIISSSLHFLYLLLYHSQIHSDVRWNALNISLSLWPAVSGGRGQAVAGIKHPSNTLAHQTHQIKTPNIITMLNLHMGQHHNTVFVYIGDIKGDATFGNSGLIFCLIWPWVCWRRFMFV